MTNPPACRQRPPPSGSCRWSRRSFLPQPASAQTRVAIPAGYGVQEQCLPFTAASALGFVIPSPIGFGLCAPAGVAARLPRVSIAAGSAGCRRPASPTRASSTSSTILPSRFVGNAYEFEGIPVEGRHPAGVLGTGRQLLRPRRISRTSSSFICPTSGEHRNRSTRCSCPSSTARPTDWVSRAAWSKPTGTPVRST